MLFNLVLYMKGQIVSKNILKKPNQKLCKGGKILNNKNQDALISESASENKRRRGRPTVFQRDRMECMESLCAANDYMP